VNIAERVITTSASGTPNTTVAPLHCNSSTAVTEAPQWAALFDTARCTGVTVHARTESLPDVSAVQHAAWALAFDPGNAAAYPSVVGIMVTSQKIGPFSCNSGGTAISGTYSVSKSGYQVGHFKTRPMMPTAGSSPASELVGGNWFATSDTSVIAGYLKPYADSIAGVAQVVDMFIVYHMEYRNRT
jgi:hypothetical protein